MKRIEYSRQVMRVLKPAMGSGRRTIEKQIKQDRAFVYQSDNGQVFAIVRPEGTELVFVAVAGKGLAYTANEFILFAKSQGFSTLRYHTKNPHYLKHGVAAAMTKPHLVEIRKALIGADEYVYRINL